MKSFLIIVTIVFGCSFFVTSAYSQDSEDQEMSCDEIMAQEDVLKKDYKSAKHAESKAFKNWDKYYKQLHSIEYGGTERPLADTAKACESGEGPDELFCKEALKRFGELSSKESKAKKELDAAKAQAGQKGEEARVISAKAEAQACGK